MTFSKVRPLADAVRELTRPGMSLHLGYGGGRPNAAVAELVRQYRGSSPGFTVSAHGFVNTQHALVAAGLVDRLVVAYAGENYPSPRPNPALQRAVRDGSVQVRNWSLWTLTARLMAGALGLDFLPVRSLAGSGIAAEHDGGDVRSVDAYGSTSMTVAALRPDLVLVHGIAADVEGNVILPAPYGEGAWGALAAREGVLACVEKVVSTDEIRAHNTLPSIPGHAVKAVCVTPFGAHPYGMDTLGFPGVDGYGEDDAFMAELRSAAKTPSAMAEWIDTWLTGDHDSFLAALGADRLAALRAEPGPPPPLRTGPATADERMTAAAVRLLRDRVPAGGHDLVLAGIGYAHLASWTAVQRLNEQGNPVRLAAELGMTGFVPQPGDPYLFARRNFPTCLQLTDVLSVLGRDVSGPGTSCLGVLGAGQVDAAGNINSTWSPGGDYVVGSGGANDVASAADEVVVVIKHSPQRLVPDVGYITAPGHRVSTIVTSSAILERRGDTFTATRHLLDTTPQDAAEQIRATTGWPIEISPTLSPEPTPDATDLTLLRTYDPTATFLR